MISSYFWFENDSSCFYLPSRIVTIIRFPLFTLAIIKEVQSRGLFLVTIFAPPFSKEFHSYANLFIVHVSAVHVAKLFTVSKNCL